MSDIQQAVRALGPGPLRETALIKHIHPLFARVLAHTRTEIYLANHSLGRPPDQMAQDVQDALQSWYEKLNYAWAPWLERVEAFRAQIAELIHAPSADCIIPKASAGQGLRAILNCFDQKIEVLSTRDEFSSIDFILKNYAQRGRIGLTQVKSDKTGRYSAAAIISAAVDEAPLLVVSMVLFTTGQVFSDLDELIDAVHTRGGLVLVDLYHAAGVVPMDIEQLDADFAVGGCYKYLRGGPGAGWLYIHPRHLNGTLRSLDTGWYAQPEPFAFDRPRQVAFAEGGKAFFESTPAILPFYQAKAGVELTLALGVDRLRTYSVQQQHILSRFLQSEGVVIPAEVEPRGAFLVIPNPNAHSIAAELLAKHVHIDARARRLRLCPDILNTEEELRIAAAHIAETMRMH